MMMMMMTMFNSVQCQVYNEADRPGTTRVNKTVKN